MKSLGKITKKKRARESFAVLHKRLQVGHLSLRYERSTFIIWHSFLSRKGRVVTACGNLGKIYLVHDFTGKRS